MYNFSAYKVNNFSTRNYVNLLCLRTNLFIIHLFYLLLIPAFIAIVTRIFRNNPENRKFVSK